MRFGFAVCLSLGFAPFVLFVVHWFASLPVLAFCFGSLSRSRIRKPGRDEISPLAFWVSKIWAEDWEIYVAVLGFEF